MPYSYDTFDARTEILISQLRPATVLDVGSGAGKYGHIVRRISARDGFKCNTTAYEIDDSYVVRFGLREMYDEVHVSDVMELLIRPRIRFDLAIIGDCIEHLRKSDGLDLLNFLVYRTKHILIIYPEKFIQDDWEGHAAEAHISTWDAQDFHNWEIESEVKAGGMHWFLIKGYQ